MKRRKLLNELKALREEIAWLRREVAAMQWNIGPVTIPVQIKLPPPPPENPPEIHKIEPGWPYPPSPTCGPLTFAAYTTTSAAQIGRTIQ